MQNLHFEVGMSETEKAELAFIDAVLAVHQNADLSLVSDFFIDGLNVNEALEEIAADFDTWDSGDFETRAGGAA